MKTALVTGITGQDGSYLSELLLEKEYQVIGVKRRTSTNNLNRLNKSVNHPNSSIVEGEVADSGCVYDLVNKYVNIYMYIFLLYTIVTFETI